MDAVQNPPGQSLPLEGLYEQYRPVLHALARRWVKDSDRCDDLVQESLLLSWRKKVAFSDSRAFLAWSRETIRYLAFAENRSKRPAPPAPAPESAGVDGADEVLNCVLRVLRLNPDENHRTLSAFLLHSIFRMGIRYLSYVLEAPRSTVARKFESIRLRLAEGRWEAASGPREARAAIPIVEDLSFNLIRERLMAPECRPAKETCAFPNELLWKALERVPEEQSRLLGAIVTNISYCFRRCEVDCELDSERSRILRMLDSLPTSTPESRYGADYMVLRSRPGAGRESWQELLRRFEKREPWGLMVTVVEQAHGWEQAGNYLSTHFRRSEIDNSFYLSYLAALYSLRRGEPRIAHRHLTRILEFYCPEYFRTQVDELRASCVEAWHQGGIPLPETSRLLA